MSVFHYIKYINDNAYIIKREMPKHIFTIDNQIKMDWLAEFRDYLSCNHVLQTERTFLFCEIIEDAKIIENE
jgi:hypothetical protein